jgi:MoaA/NifB/PqqE/SkfB family radical SAM enzyme/alpha-beta hydrolase superfamily lysophospholipase
VRALAQILVHGYLGSPGDLAPLAQALENSRNEGDDIESLCLPGHDGGDDAPAFDEGAFRATVAAAIERQRAAGRRIVLVGHSTGGSVILAELVRRMQEDPASLDDVSLLVLCATPPRIGTDYVRRWRAHRDDVGTGNEPRLDDMGKLVSLVNRPARKPPVDLPLPVLIVHGAADELVPACDAAQWQRRFVSPLRLARVPDAGHHLFCGRGSDAAIDTVCRTISDVQRRVDEPAALDALFALVPDLRSFVADWPDRRRHLLECPTGRRVLGEHFEPEAHAHTEPTQANIEITTQCTLGCTACARTLNKLKSKFMSRETFVCTLDALPHAWRVVLVGLGETLLHPEVLDFIRLAVAAKRRVSLVTNAMQLDADMARALCSSGLSGITFSLDAMDQELATRVRLGSDMPLIRENIRGLLDEKNRRGASLATSVFTALTGETIGELKSIIDFVADSGIDALMVSDLNFPANQPRSVRQALTPEYAGLLRQALRHAAARRLPVVSVLGLEEYALEKRFPDYFLSQGKQIAQRSSRRTNCLSPWQTAPVNVHGNVTFCDCQPNKVVGNHRLPVSHWWNGPAMIEQRRLMLSDQPPPDCLACPRF